MSNHHNTSSENRFLNGSDLNPDFTDPDLLLEQLKNVVDLPSQTLHQENEKITVAKFPVETFPTAMQQIVYETHRTLKYPIDFIAGSLLFASSLAIGNAYKVRVKEGWIENAVLYIAFVGRPGTNKSHPLSFALNPIHERDKEMFKEYEMWRKEYERTKNSSKEEQKQEGVSETVKPFWQKSIVSDYTPEALVAVLNHNQRGIGVYADELLGWFKRFDQYHKGGEQEFWLSNWSGKFITVDRKSDDPILISHPFISVAGTIQYAVLPELGKEGRAHNGFKDRILFVAPDDLKKEYWSTEDLDPTISKNWNTIINNLFNLPFGKDADGMPVSNVFSYTPEAFSLLLDWQRTITDKCNSIDDEILASTYSKLETYIIRFSLILQLMYWSCGEADSTAIETRAIEGAIQLADYFLKTAMKINAHLYYTSPIELLSTDKRRVYEALPEHFKTADGVIVATSMGMPGRTFARFLKDKSLFERLSRGEYEKLY